MSDKDDAIPEAERLGLALEQLSLSNDNKSEESSQTASAALSGELHHDTIDQNIEKILVQLSAGGKSSVEDKKTSEPTKPTLGISSSEFYYNLGLRDIEALSQQSKTISGREKEREKRERYKNNQLEKKMEMLKMKKEKQQLQKVAKESQRERTISTSSGASSQQKLSKKKSGAASVLMANTNGSPQVLLDHLKKLQSGKITSVQNLKMNPLPKPKQPEINKAEEIKRNKEEVQKLNQQIQEKIALQIKPKLRKIMNRMDNQIANGLIDESDRSAPRDQPQYVPARRPIMPQTRPVPIVKTPVQVNSKEQVEIYRYTQEDLNQLQSSATYEYVPRLLKFKLCSTIRSDVDSLLFKLLECQNEDQRQDIILTAAASRKLIERVGQWDFKYASEPVAKEPVEELPSKKYEEEDRGRTRPSTDKQESREIERIKSLAKTDEELNSMIYDYEVLQLFGSCIKDQSVLQGPLSTVIQYLIDTKQAHVIEGEVRVNGKNNQEAYVSHPKGLKDVCISKIILRQHSFQGDFVRVLVKQSEDIEATASSSDDGILETSTDDDLDATNPPLEPISRNYGCVLEIIEKRHCRRVIGSLSCNGNGKRRRNAVFNVRDSKIPNLQLSNNALPKDPTDKMLMVAEIIGWRHDQPKGKIVEVIGEKGQLKSENAAILLQHNLNPQPFSQEILDKLPTEPFTIPAEEFAYRQDLRKKCIFSIDPETARDLDDALSCEVLENGNLEVGVHISDVSYFLKENSELDEIVKEKATTIYLVDTVYHMLPVPLCLLCSLLPGSDKMAYSVFWEMNGDTTEIISTRFTRSVLNSCAKLSYDHAQMVIDNKFENWSVLEEFPEIHNGFTVSDVANVILKLQKLAVIMRTNRKENGALKIDQPKIAFKFDSDDQRMEAPVDFFQYVTKDSNKLIEEFMLLANISVAKFINEKFPTISLLRSHDPPNEDGLKKLVKTLQKHGIQIDISSSSAISDSMERLIGNAKNTAGMNAALNLMVSKTMTRARYFCSDMAKKEEDFWHYALSIPIYTHFTSPIRRYADILVHRVLNAALEYESPPSRTPEEVQTLANICNAQKYSAKLAGEDSSTLYFMQFLRSLKEKPMLAGIIGVFEYNLEVVLVETGHVFKVYYKNLQQNDEMIIKTYTESSPPFITAYWPRLQLPAMKLAFGSQVMVQVSVNKDKLVGNRIFYQAN